MSSYSKLQGNLFQKFHAEEKDGKDQALLSQPPLLLPIPWLELPDDEGPVPM